MEMVLHLHVSGRRTARFAMLICCISAVITTMVFGTLFFILPRDKRLDKYGSIDYMGIILGISGLILFNFAWK